MNVDVSLTNTETIVLLTVFFYVCFGSEKCIVQTNVREDARNHDFQTNASSIVRYVVRSANVCLRICTRASTNAHAIKTRRTTAK